MSKVYVVDTSVVVDGRISRMVEGGELRGCEIVVPQAVLAELEHQANSGRDSGFSGLAELRRLRELAERGQVRLSFAGQRPTADQLAGASAGAIDAAIRDLARERGAVLVTSDAVMAEVGRVEGLEVMFLKPLPVERRPRLLEYFDENTMSVHLKDRVRPMAKVGRPGKFELKVLDERPLSEEELREMAREIIELARQDPDGFIELEREGATIVQFREYRIAIARPPFSDGFEITAVRPVAEVKLEDYRLSDKLKERLSKQAEGVLIAGPPGAGKSTFAQALAELYRKQGKIVKTMESPRDLQVSDEITQYSPLEGDMERTADVLLLVRPDYTIYDEMRKTKDFQIFTDMRLAGIGMVGVVHATRAIDAIQRLIGRVELGMIPMIADTVIFIKDGEIKEVYSLKSVVKVPHGMVEADLARPIIQVCDFETDEPVYEIYSFGEEIVVMPVRRREPSKAERKLAEEIRREIKRRARADVDVEVLSEGEAVVRADPEAIPKIIGRGGRTIDAVQRRLGVKIDVREREEPAEGREELGVEVKEEGGHVILMLGREHRGENVEIYAGDAFLFKATVGARGDIRIERGSEFGRQLRSLVAQGVPIRAVRA
ncbi:MAG: PINc/VapC family ATPase [Candidatus Hadarchaeales archaeon]